MAASQTYRKLYTRLWRHRGFVRLSHQAKVVTLYLLTGPQTNTIGCYGLSLALTAEDLSISQTTCVRLIREVCTAFDWEWDEDERQVWIPSWPKWNPQISPNQGKAWRNEIQGLPECKAKVSLTVALDLPKSSQPEDNRIQNKNKNKEQNQKQKVEAEVVQPQPLPSRTQPLHGRRNPDLMTYGPIPLWASQFRDVIVPLVASHYVGDRDAADKVARQWVAEWDSNNQAVPPLSGAVTAPQQWWREKAIERWSSVAAPKAEICPICGHPEPRWHSAVECNTRFLAQQREA